MPVKGLELSDQLLPCRRAADFPYNLGRFEAQLFAIEGLPVDVLDLHNLITHPKGPLQSCDIDTNGDIQNGRPRFKIACSSLNPFNSSTTRNSHNCFRSS